LGFLDRRRPRAAEPARNRLDLHRQTAEEPAKPPLKFEMGDIVELVFVNRTPMPHPMHLHGHEFQVVEIDGDRFAGAVRDTVLVTPGRRVVVAFDALNPGLGALHCHLLYHLEAGMFTTIRYV
jgi:FtsP/CotA-like multicopper oxidase with cupredoxin domain